MATNKLRNPTLEMTNEELDQLVISEYPHPFAVQYKLMLETTSLAEQIQGSLQLFEFGLRTVTVVLLNQYLNQDVAKVNDESFNRFLLNNLPEATVGTWVELFFRSLKVYENKQELFFTPELYELFWDTSQQPHKARSGIQDPFHKLAQLRNAWAHHRLPTNEASWKNILSNLREVFKQFSFIRNYGLIRITEKLNGSQYKYQIYKGQQTANSEGNLWLWREKEKELQSGWFYLFRKGHQVLELHPFLIAWTEKNTLPVEMEAPYGIALYDRLQKTKVNYVSLLNQEQVEYDRPLLDQILVILHYYIEEIRLGQGSKVKFAWEELRAGVKELSQHNIGAIRQKYDPRLYLQRKETFRQFEDFLASNQTFFVLVGKSGVGKSNFILSLADEYRERGEVCYLVYDAARLQVPETMLDKIGQDLRKQLGLADGTTKNLFDVLNEPGYMDGRTLLLIFDAINENVDGRTLLQKIDQIIGDKVYPWLKVVITSRPQAWRTLKRGLHLAIEHYYQEQGNDDLAVEIPEFAVKLEDFGRTELELAYANYRRVYDLQTPYELLHVPIREALRDPLVLRLVADIYRNKPLPTQIQISDIYERYVQALLKTERLEQEDLYFLEREILPRMLSEQSYDNKLTTEQLYKAQTTDGRPLWELIRSTDRLSGDQPVNASYARLANAEILIEQGPPTNYEISFKYERFYDYYGSKRLLEIAGQQQKEKWPEIYQTWILATQKHPFLWGSIQNALQVELERENHELVTTLCQSDKQVVKEMMVASLAEYGQEEHQNLKTLLQKLLEMGQDDLTFRQRLFAWQNIEPPPSIINAKKAAIEVAGILGETSILTIGHLDRSTHVRIHAIRQTLNLWHRDRQQKGNSASNNRGFIVLCNVVDQVRTALLPNMQAAESAGVMLFYIGLTTYGDIRRRQEEDLGQALRKLIRQTLDQVLYIGEKGISGAVLRNYIRELVINTVVKVATRTTTDSPESFAFNPKTAGAFLRRPRSEKELLLTVTKYYDARNEDVEILAESLPKVLALDEPLVDHAVQFALLIQWQKNRERVLEMATFLFEEGMKRDVPAYITYASTGTLIQVLMQGERNEELEQQFFSWQHQLMTKAKGKVMLSGDAYLRAEFAAYFEVMYTLNQRIDTEFLISLAERAVMEEDVHFLKAISLDLRTLASRKEFHKPILAITETLLKSPHIREQLINLLAKLRRFAADDVDDFMVVHELPNEMQTKVKTTEVKEEIGEDFIKRPLSAAFEAMVGSPELQPIAQWIVNRSVYCDSLDQWFSLAFKRLINLAYGEDVFKLEH